jgi:hypothetical protein
VTRLAQLADQGDLETEYLPMHTEDAEWAISGAVHGATRPQLPATKQSSPTNGSGGGPTFRGPWVLHSHVNSTLAVRPHSGALCGESTAHTAEASSYWIVVGETQTGAPQIRGIG